MDILISLHQLLAFFRRNRQTGHTTFARTIASVNGVVICANEKEANEIGRKRLQIGKQDQKPSTVSLERIMDMDGRRPVPAVLDNSTVMKICEKAIDRIMTKEAYIRELTQTIHEQRREYEAKLKAKDEQIASWKRTYRNFKYSNPKWAEVHITAKRSR